MTDLSKLTRIRALLDNAESYAQQGNNDAAESYRNKAISLMARHGIEEAMLSARHHRDEVPVQRRVDLPRPYPQDKAALLNAITQALGARAIRFTGQEPHMILVGFDSDLDRVELLYTSLLIQAFAELARTPLPHDTNRVSFTKSWLAGFATVVGSRIEDAEARARGEYAAENGVGTEIVVRDRSQRVESTYAQLFPQRRTTRRSVGSGVGYLRGRDAGQRADIGARKVSTTRRAIDD